MNASLYPYLFLGILVNCLWGIVFLVPYYFHDVDAAVIALGRYITYGSIASALIYKHRKTWLQLWHKHSTPLLKFALVGNIGYYLMLVHAIQLTGLVSTTLILGMLPVTMMVVGHLSESSFSFKPFYIPIFMLISGLLTLNLPPLLSLENSQYSLLGLALALLSLITWTWFGVSNARYLKTHPDISAEAWAAWLGALCLPVCLVLAPVLGRHFFIQVQQGLFSKQYLLFLTLSCIFIGIVVSWLSTIWWNKVSRHLPVVICGQLLVFETLASLCYGFINDQRWPLWHELIASILILSGVVLALSRSIGHTQHEKPPLS